MSFLWYWPAGGWKFDQWKAACKWEPVASQQSGSARPLPLVKEKEETAAHWEREASYWRGISDQLLGTLRDEPPKEQKWEWLGDELMRVQQPGYRMRRLRFQLTGEEWGYAWLLWPDKPGRHAAVIALHQTQPAGKHEAVGLEMRPGNEYLAYGSELAERGFVVLAPDAIAFGERMAEQGAAFYRSAEAFFTAHPEGSVMGKMAYDTSRAVDLLQQLPMVDGQRIGCIGHSHGGYGTLFAMVQDQRIKAGVISCGVTMLRADPSPQRWWRMTSLMPRLGFFEGRIQQAPIDFHHWLALVAPRPLCVNVGLQDAIFPNTAPVKEALDEVAKVYRLYGAQDKLLPLVFDGPHSFPQEHRQQAYELLERSLRG